MNTQTKPPEKFILDATAGFRMMWFNKKHPNCIYLDQRPECEPDIVGDFRDLKQFRDETFRLVVFDPPHIIQKSPAVQSGMFNRFGYLEPEKWQSELKEGFQELWRVLANYGILIFKWANANVDSSTVLKLFSVKPLFYQVTAKQTRTWQNQSRSNREPDKVRTLWFCFMKIPREALEQ